MSSLKRIANADIQVQKLRKKIRRTLDAHDDELSVMPKLKGERIRPALKSSLKGAQHTRSRRRIVDENLYKYTQQK
jgi:hypothetical protein